jgi:hypothetical protein
MTKNETYQSHVAAMISRSRRPSHSHIESYNAKIFSLLECLERLSLSHYESHNSTNEVCLPVFFLVRRDLK